MVDAFNNIFSSEDFIRFVIILAVVLVMHHFGKRLIELVVRHSVRKSRFKTEREERQHEDTLISIISTSMRVVLWIVGVLLVLELFDINIGPLIAGAGIAGVALGFGAQSMVKDFLAGMFILAENQYRVGDVVMVNNGVAGVVESIRLRMTVLRDLEGKVHYVPNGTIDMASNLTMEYANVELDVGVGYASDLDKVEEIIDAVGKEIYADEDWKDIALEPPHMLRVDRFAESSIIIKVVCRTAPIRQWEVKSEILRRVKKAFDKEGIEIPFPQRVIHTKEEDSKK